MANINVTYTENTITVDENTSNVNVTTTTNNITVSSASVASNADIRAALSNTSPITYNSTTGVIGVDSAALFTGKTTSDLPEGTNLYFTNARVGAYISSSFTTTDIPEGANLYYTTARANAAIDTKFANTVITFSKNAIFSQGFYNPLYNVGNVSGSSVILTVANGVAQEVVLTGNVGYISFSDWQNASTLYINVKQDATGGKIIDFTNPNYATNGWEFYNGDTTIDTAPNAETLITIQNISNKRYATIHTGNTSSLTNAQVISYIANNNLTVGGTLNVNGNTTIANISTTRISPIGANIFIGPIDIPASTAQRINTNRAFEAPSIFSGGIIEAAGYIETTGSDGISTRTGNISSSQGGDIYSTNMGSSPTGRSGNIYTLTGNIIGAYLHGNGSNITGIASNAGVVSYIATQPLTVGGNLTVNGNINATGNINYQNVTDLYVTDQKITLNSNAATNANVEIISNRPTATNTMLKWNEDTDRWTFTNDGTTFYNIPTSTSDLAEGTNLYFTAARVRGNISASENITYNNSTGVIGLANSLANVNSVSAESSQNLTLISDKTVIQGRVNGGTTVPAANVEGLGYAVYDSTTSYYNDPSFPFITYSGTEELKQLIFDGTCTTGSNVITITNIYDAAGNTMSVSNVKQYYGFSEFPGTFAESKSFPTGTYVTGVSGSNVYMSANAVTTTTFYADLSVTGYSLGCLFPMALDLTNNVGFGIESDYDAALFGSPPGSATTVALTATNNLNPTYGYPISGPVKADFVFPYDTANFSVASFANVTLAKTDIGASRTVPAFTRGLTVGAGDLTNRGVGDKGSPTFGVNILWDGTANVTQEYSSSGGVTPQILLRSFSDGTIQGINGNTATTWSSGGPRLLFINGYGKATNDLLTTYARTNQELGKIGFLTTTAFNTNPSAFAPTAFISAVSLKDQNTGPGDVGLYLVASPTTSGTSTNQIGGATAKALFVGHHKANTIISAGSRTNSTAGNVIFAPARQSSATAGSQGNVVQMAELIVNSANGSPHWATIGYDVPTSNTGARIAITNGNNTTSARNGNLSLAINRKDNGVGFGSKEWAFKLRSGQTDLVLTEDDVVRTTFAGGNITATTFVGNLNGTTATLTGNVNASTFIGNLSGTTATLTGNVNATNYNGNTVILTSPTSSGTYVSNVAIDTNGWFEYHGNGQAFFSIQNSGQSGVFTHGERISFTGVTGNGAANLNNQTFYVDVVGSQSNIYYPFYLDQSLTTSATMSGLGITDGGTNGGSALYDYTPGVTGSTWTIDPNGANLDITNGTATTVIDTAGNLTVPGNINLTGRLLGYDQVYGEFAYTAGNIVPAAPDTIYAFPLDTTNMASDIVANNTSRINITKPGKFKLIMSLQVKNADNANDHLLRFWLRKNGTNVANSATLVTPLKLQEQVIAMDWMVESDGDDYWEIVYYVNDTDVTFPYYAAITSPVTAPAAPPIIVNVIPVGA